MWPWQQDDGADGLANEPRIVTPLLTDQRFPDNTVKNSRYTLLTFLPLNLYEQFKRPLNLYFLLVAALQFITIIAPVNPLSTLLPLLFAFSLTAAKEGYDDIKRHRADDEYNSRRFRVLDPQTSEWVDKASSEMVVGDVILLEEDVEIPCDCVAIAAPADSNGIVFIRTENLDGEIDLKPRDAVPRTDLTTASPLSRVRALVSDVRLTCPPPNASIEAFDSTVEFPQPGSPTSRDRLTVSLSHRHLLLQSAYVKNTESIIALVVYTGNETKCGKNKKPAPVKWAKIDRAVSRYSMIIFTCQITCALIFGMVGYARNMGARDEDWYLAMGFGAEVSGLDASRWSIIIYPLRFFLLTSVMIPISFKFVVDMSKAYMALVLEWDLAMWDDEREEGMRVKDSSIVEDLAQIDYVLSDKTGTLTQNVMTLKSLIAGGECFEELPLDALAPPKNTSVGTISASSRGSGPPGSMSRSAARYAPPPARAEGSSASSLGTVVPPYQPAQLGDVGRALALCNTVEITNRHGTHLSVRYTSVSPDEVALAAGAAALGYDLSRRTRDEATLIVDGQIENYRVLNVFAFTSERKCMSILLERLTAGDDDRRFMLLSKGADERVMTMLAATPQNDAVKQQTQSLVNEFAKRGLRTLVFARRILKPEEVQSWSARYEEAITLIEGRQSAVHVLQRELEKDMDVLGASAVEDALQEDVAGTITSLLEANVGVWMLTGDKVATAQQISVSCGLLPVSVTSSPEDGSSATPTYLKLTAEGWEETLGRFRPNEQLNRQRLKLRDSRAAATQDGLAAIVRGLVSRVRGTPSQPLADTSSSSSNYGTSASLGGRPSMERDGGPAGGNVIGIDGMSMLVEGGPVLDRILASPDYRERFLAAAMVSKAVVCARVTPSQKAAITALVNSEYATTLAIGDGGNDVSMIQVAHVGVGIIGKEGQQAARAADFAITQFKHLRPLMFVHGHMSYARTCYVVQYSFYKSMLISFIQLAYNIFFGGMSGVSFWNSFFLTVWNGVYTLPQTFFYTLDRCAPRHILMRDPRLYRWSQAGYRLTKTTFFSFILRGILQSCGVLFLLWLMYSGDFAQNSTGYGEANDILFTVAYTTLIMHQMFTVILESNSITAVNAVFLIGMPVTYLATTAIYSVISPRLDFYGVFAQSMYGCHWLFVIVAVAILYLPHQWVHQALLQRAPSDVDTRRQACITRQRAVAESRATTSWGKFVARWLTVADDEVEAQSSPLTMPSAMLRDPRILP